jgi:hypothetical protein
MNASNKGAHTAFHVDKGTLAMSALSIPCRKLWICAEDTEQNLTVLSRYPARSIEAFAQIIWELENPIMIRQTAEHVLILPPGLIHGTYTEKTGILYGNNLVAWRHIESITKCLLYSLEGDDDDATRECIKLFEAVTQYIIKYGDCMIQHRAFQCFSSNRLRHFLLQKWKAEFNGSLKLWRLHFKKRDLFDPQDSMISWIFEE